MNDHLQALEERLGYHFRDRNLLLQALTHTSFANEHKKQGIGHNERLEFLGDAVLETISSEYLYKTYPKLLEGELSKIRASMVCEPSLAICARFLGLPDYLRLGKGEELMGGRKKESIISDAMEAVIGAMYLDGGFTTTKAFVEEHVLRHLKNEELYRDNKTHLQEIVQEAGKRVEYVILEESGPDHDKSFTVAAVLEGATIGVGTGRTKKAASQAAAEAALRKMGE